MAVMIAEKPLPINSHTAFRGKRSINPEDARRLLEPAIYQMMDAVYRYEGTVNQVLGDGIAAGAGLRLVHRGP